MWLSGAGMARQAVAYAEASPDMISTLSVSLSATPAFMRRALDYVLRGRSPRGSMTLVGLVVACTIAAPAPARAQEKPPQALLHESQAKTPQALLHEYKCYICHADTEAKAGPAYVDVAASYRGKRDAVATIAAIVRNGRRGGGPWHMPPHPEVSDADARAMARYILSLDR